MEKKTFLGSIMRGDSWIWGIYLLLFFISIIEMFSASSRLVYRSMTSTDPVFHHMQLLFGGLVAVMVFQSFSAKALRNWAITFYFLGLLFFVLMLLFGREFQGATRSIGGIQPAEICKVGLMMILSLALSLKDEIYQRMAFFRKNTELRRFWFYLLLIVLVAVPIALQNLSTGLIIGMASLSVMWVGEVKVKFMRTLLLFAVTVGITFGALLFALYTKDSQDKSEGKELVDLGALNRAHTWANRVFHHDEIPLADQKPNDENSQVIHAHMALANSFPFGKFIGNSQLRDRLPEAYSDYIFAIIFEEMGFEGALFVIFLYLLLLWRCFYLSTKTSDVFIRLLMIALPTLIAIQALIHIGVCTDAMFVTGQPLPLISRGGSSVLFTSVSFGIILALSRIIKAERDAKMVSEVPQIQVESV
ncbi:MAG: FtsW/RodA/SpoVE family cell cycle protein [Bacteroidales bacterium]|nr:FtsW/RodA/SpoVE family cell cycle protein [Bacteroidales bacterium]